jgi:hypothetical protein
MEIKIPDVISEGEETTDGVSENNRMLLEYV